jgi:predicted Na+-dependent transporter
VLSSLLGSRFWITAYVMLALGFTLPGEWQWLRPSIPFLLGGILYFSCLKISLNETTSAISQRAMWWRLGWLSAVKLLVSPLLAYGATLLIAPDWATGILLLTMMPAGFACLAFADLLRGNRITTLLLLLTTSALVPLTVPLLLAIFAGTPVSAAAMAHETGYIAMLLLSPFLLAQITRITFPVFIARHYERWNAGSIASACLLIFVGAAVNRHSWEHLPFTDIVIALGLTILATVISAGCALFCGRILPRGDAIAFTCVAIYMNNGLAMAFATEFFPGQPHLLLPTIVVQLPIMIGVPIMNWVMEPRSH